MGAVERCHWASWPQGLVVPGDEICCDFLLVLGLGVNMSTFSSPII
jgi:hypothetical protein